VRDALLFGESQSRMLLSVRRKNLSRLRDLAQQQDVHLQVLGEVRGHAMVIEGLVTPVESARAVAPGPRAAHWRLRRGYWRPASAESGGAR
jgi:hypothetical protein